MNKKFLIGFILFLSVIIITGCSQKEVEENDVTDETVFSPPEQEGELIGTWTATQNEITANQYFYDDGKLVSIYQDPEGKTWVDLAYYSNDNNQISIKDPKYYLYNIDSNNWSEEDSSSIGFISGRKENDDTLVIEQTLPDGNNVSFTYKRGLADLVLPGEIEITSDINTFLIH